METPLASEPEPKRSNSIHRLLCILLLIFVFASCQNKKQEKPGYPVVIIGSTVIKHLEKQKQDSLLRIKPDKKKIYITFDDGPNKGTSNIFKAIKEENVPVSFFIVGEHVFDSPLQYQTWEILKDDSTIELCNHSYTHAHNRYVTFYKKPLRVVSDFRQSQAKLQFKNNLARMPGRNAWRIDSINHTDIYASSTAIDSVHAAGFNIIGWDIEWTFNHKTLAPDTDTTLLLRRINNMLQARKTPTPDHLVLLAHDQAFRTEEDVQLLKAFLASLKNNPDYELMLASSYPGVGKK